MHITIAPALEKFLLISAGAILGANLRYWVADWAIQRWGASFPYGTLLINLTGSLLLGLFLTLAAGRFLDDPRLRLLVAAGFFGSYTTFSTYTFESLTLFLQGQGALGLLNAAGSAIAGLLAAGLGVFIGKSL